MLSMKLVSTASADVVCANAVTGNSTACDLLIKDAAELVVDCQLARSKFFSQ